MYKPSRTENFVVAFDYGDEAFRVVPHATSKDCVHVENLGGRLCICERSMRIVLLYG